MTTTIVTGAASGMGLACARLLLSRGHNVAAVDLRADALEAALPRADALARIVADVAAPGDCARAVAETAGRFGGVDALAHFAGIHSPTPWHALEEAEWDRVLAVDLKGSFFMAQAAARAMVAQRKGRIVLVSSDSVHTGGVGQGAGGPAYIAAKSGVIGLTRTLARALARDGVTVNAISPGLIRTPMLDGLPAALQQVALGHIPAGAFGEPVDVAAVAAFLISDEARYVTGEIVEVNGGLCFA
jgi:3-oxoacyl-[acyl-carrier protein] reductase